MVKSRINIHQIINALFIAGVAVLLISSSVRSTVVSTLQGWLLQTGLMDAEATLSGGLGSVDRPLPLVALDGTPLDTSTLVGKPVFLHIWASWCPPCIAELPDIQQLVRAVSSEEVAFLLVTVDKDVSKAQRFLQKNQYTDLPVYYPTERLPTDIQYNVIPTTYVIAPSGRIVYKHEGLAQYNHEEFKRFLQATQR